MRPRYLRPALTMPQIYLYRAPIDFRKQAHGLAALVEQQLGTMNMKASQQCEAFLFLASGCISFSGKIYMVYPFHIQTLSRPEFLALYSALSA